MSALIPNYTVKDRRHSAHPSASDNLFNHSGTQSDGMRLRVTVPAERAQTTNAISKWDWQKSLTLTRQLYTRVAPINGALLQKALYVVGDAWTPEYEGSNTKWGEEATELLETWFKVCDLRGEPYDFQTNLFITSLALDRCGDEAMVLTRNDAGEPRICMKPAHCITTRYGEWGVDESGFGTVPDGKFKGARIYNGVIFDRRKRVIGYNLLGDTAAEDEQLPTVSCQLLYEPDWADQGRGIQRLLASLLDWMDYEDIHHFLKRQVKQDSAQGILHYNEHGAADVGKNFIEENTSTSNSDVKIERLEGNEIMYFKAMGGGKIEPYNSSRPHPNVDSYTMRIIRGALQSAGWFYELYDPSEIGGSSTRLIQDMARMSVWWRQKTLRKRAMRAVYHALAVFMDTGVLSRNDDDWHKWGFTLPGEITVDARYDDKTWLERIRMAAGTYMDYYGEKGGGWKRKIRQRIIEQKFLEEECKKEGVDPNKVQMLTPNGNDQAEAKEEKEEDKKPTK